MLQAECHHCCSAVWCSAASFLTVGMFECDIAHRRSVAILCMLYKIRCNSMHPLCGVPYVPVRFARGALVVHRYTYAPPRYRTSQHRSTTGLLFTCQYLCGTILVTPYSMVWDWRVSRAGPTLFYWPKLSIITIVFYYFSLSLLSVDIGWHSGTGVFGLLCVNLYLSLAVPTSFNNYNNNNTNIIIDHFNSLF